MQIDITLIPDDKLLLPLPYNQVVQGFIYNHLEDVLSSWLHDEAYEFNQRRYKLFVFGRLVGKYTISEKRIEFQGPISLSVRSVNKEVISSFAEELIDKKRVILGRTWCTVSNISITPDPNIDLSKPVQIRAISPITVYSTLRAFDGRKKTYYYFPMETDWERQILENLVRKSQAVDGIEYNGIPDGARIKPKRVDNSHMKIIKYKSTIIKGWMGTYETFLPQDLFFIGYNGGFGAKNSQGFGMVEIINK